MAGWIAAPRQLAWAEPAKRVYIVHSYGKSDVCGQPQYEGVVTALDRAGWRKDRNLVLAAYHMDTRIVNNTPELIEQQGQKALAEIRQFNPDVVVTLDDNAFQAVAMKLVDTPIRIVFSGLNRHPEDYNAVRPYLDTRQHPGHNVTGVCEKLHAVEAIRVFSRIIPLKRLAVLSDPFPIGRAVARQVRRDLNETDPERINGVRVDFQEVPSWEAYQQAVGRINNDPEIQAFYLATVMLKDERGAIRTIPDIIQWTVAHSKKPAIGINYEFIKLGLFGGATVDFYAMGLQAGELVVSILQGQTPGDLPIQDTERTALVFNLKRANQLGITIPPDILLAADDVFGY